MTREESLDVLDHYQRIYQLEQNHSERARATAEALTIAIDALKHENNFSAIAQNLAAENDKLTEELEALKKHDGCIGDLFAAGYAFYNAEQVKAIQKAAAKKEQKRLKKALAKKADKRCRMDGTPVQFIFSADRWDEYFKKGDKVE